MMTMTKTTDKEAQVAKELYEARKNHQPLKMADYKDRVTDYDSAYRVQWANTALQNEKVGGYKVSLTSEQTQKMFDSDSPFYGVELASSWLKSGAKLPLFDLMDPLLEVELMFEAKEALKPTDSVEELLAKCNVSGAVELPDCRFADWFPALDKYLVVSDSAVAGRVVYAPATKAQLSVDALATVNATLSLDGKELAHGSSSEVLGNPVNSLKWLVEKLAAQGRDYPAGTKVSSGTFLLPPHAQKGHYEAKFDKFFGTVSFDLL